MSRIYVASSWRNAFQQDVVANLRDCGHTVYNFREDGDGWGNSAQSYSGFGGFHWSKVDPNWQKWSEDIEKYITGLDDWRAVQGFHRDMDALKKSEVCVMVMPCGPSASMEMGWACGSGRFVVVYVPAIKEPDLMVKMANVVTNDWGTVCQSIRDWEQRDRSL